MSEYPGRNKCPLTDKSVVGYLPSPAPGLPITTTAILQPTAIHPRAKHSKTQFPSFPLHFLESLQSLHNSLHLLLTRLAPVCQSGRSVRRRPVAVTESHAALAATSLFYLPPCHPATLPPNPTCHSARPFLLYSTAGENTEHTKYKIQKMPIPNSTQCDTCSTPATVLYKFKLGRIM